MDNRRMQGRDLRPRALKWNGDQLCRSGRVVASIEPDSSFPAARR
jgi:hypothetical protein